MATRPTLLSSGTLAGRGTFTRYSSPIHVVVNTLIVGPPTLVGIGTLEFTLVRACVRPSVRKILNDYPLYFSEILHGVTTLYGGNVTFSDF